MCALTQAYSILCLSGLDRQDHCPDSALHLCNSLMPHFYILRVLLPACLCLGGLWIMTKNVGSMGAQCGEEKAVGEQGLSASQSAGSHSN